MILKEGVRKRVQGRGALRKFFRVLRVARNAVFSPFLSCTLKWKQS